MASGSNKRQRGETVTVRLTKDERATLDTLASRSGLAAGAFMRAAAFGDTGPRAQRRPPADHQVLRRILGELGRIGNNINQIARRLNADQQISIPDLRQALSAYLDLRDAIFDALGMKPLASSAKMKPATGTPARQPAPPGHDHQRR